MNHGSKKSIQRFPRLMSGSEAAVLEKLVWTTPSVRARVAKTKKSAVTRLIFTIPMSPDFWKYCPLLYRLISGPQAGAWERALQTEYLQSKFNKRPLAQATASLLRGCFKRAVRLWLSQTWVQNKEQANRELSDFDERTITKHGPQPDPQLAFWAATRFAHLTSALRNLKTRLKSTARSMTSQALVEEIEKVIPYNEFREALKSAMGPLITVDPLTFFVSARLAPNVTPNRMAQAALEIELAKRGHYNSRISLRKYLKLGKEMLSSAKSI